MDSISYQTVFDIGHQFPQYWWLLGIPLVMFTAGFLMLGSKDSRHSRAFIYFFLAISGTVGIAFGGGYRDRIRAMREAITNGRYRTVEGTVADFVPADAGDHHPEHFAVVTPGGRVEYSYSESGVTQGFNQSQHHGGPLRDGLRVRIANVNGEKVPPRDRAVTNYRTGFT